jgi:hypothetical protein
MACDKRRTVRRYVLYGARAGPIITYNEDKSAVTSMGPERSGPKINCDENYRPVLSSERAPQFRIKKFSCQGNITKNLLMGPKGGPDTKIDWPADSLNLKVCS